MHSRVLIVLLSATFFAACSDRPAPLAPGEVLPAPDPVQGQLAYVQACSGCHASIDGFDVAFFGFSDTTVIRRAVKHVDTATARNIVAYLRTLGGARASRTMRLFQPGGAVLGGDLEFAHELFGRDGWPEQLDTEQLRAIDPLKVRIAVPLPLWSVEGARTDWLPDRPLPQAIVEANGGAARRAIAAYHASPTTENLQAIVRTLESSEREQPARICDLNPNAPFADFEACLDMRRWMSSLIAQHMLRTGTDRPLGYGLHSVWWDVGNVFRKTGAQPLGDDDLNQAAWIYLGWMFEPGNQTIGYTLPGFVKLGLPRHATWVALRAAVARPTGSGHAFGDVSAAADVAPAHWAYAATRFGLRHLLDRLASGDMPPADDLERAHNHVHATLRRVQKKVRSHEYDVLAALAQRVLEQLPSSN